jgi:hypothetical protein
MSSMDYKRSALGDLLQRRRLAELGPPKKLATVGRLARFAARANARYFFDMSIEHVDIIDMSARRLSHVSTRGPCIDTYPAPVDDVDELEDKRSNSASFR